MSDSQDRHDSKEQRDTTQKRDDREQLDAPEGQDVAPQKAGGFSAFSKQYRDRWAASHPNSRRIHGDADSDGVTPTRAARTSSADVEGRDTDGESEKKS
jgi:hypothetical protein